MKLLKAVGGLAIALGLTLGLTFAVSAADDVATTISDTEETVSPAKVSLGNIYLIKDDDTVGDEIKCVTKGDRIAVPVCIEPSNGDSVDIMGATIQFKYDTNLVNPIKLNNVYGKNVTLTTSTLYSPANDGSGVMNLVSYTGLESTKFTKDNNIAGYFYFEVIADDSTEQEKIFYNLYVKNYTTLDEDDDEVANPGEEPVGENYYSLGTINKTTYVSIEIPKADFAETPYIQKVTAIDTGLSKSLADAKAGGATISELELTEYDAETDPENIIFTFNVVNAHNGVTEHTFKVDVYATADDTEGVELPGYVTKEYTGIVRTY